MLTTLLTKDKEYLAALQEEQELRAKRNKVSADISEAKKSGKDASQLMEEAKKIPEQVKELTERTEKIKEEIDSFLMRLPNILHDSVPYGKDDSENQVVREVGKTQKKDFELKNHGALIEELGLGNFDSASKVSGTGFYYLFNELALMEMALQRFAIDKLMKKGFTLTQVPLMLRRKPYEGLTDLCDFETMMYKIDGEDLYLIATSEHAIGAMHQNDLLEEKNLPLKYLGVSPCFRKEIGSHGVDEKGIFRVHQFNKVEQFVFCKPEDSWKIHEELLANAEEVFKELKLPYRVVNICTGDIGIVAAKKYDIEVYMPREEKYKEVVSCSNCTSYQAVRLNVRYQKGSEREYVHTLNSTVVATSRALRAIIEHYQQKDGTIKVPDVLVPYMNGIQVIGKR